VYIAKASGVDARETDGMCGSASGIKLCFFRSHFLAQGVLKALNNLIVFLLKKKKFYLSIRVFLLPADSVVNEFKFRVTQRAQSITVGVFILGC
jgi:hypothetical protein